MDNQMTKFEELRQRMREQSAQAQSTTAPSAPAPSAPVEAEPAATPVSAAAKFEELKRKLQAGQAAPAAATAAPQAPAAAAATAVLGPEERENRILLAEVLVAPDRASAQLRLRRPPEGQPPLDAEELRNILQMRGVAMGVDEELVRRLAAQPVYDTQHVIARGAEPVNGESGKIVYRFDAEHKLLPVERADGTVDHYNLNYITNVSEGDALCDIFQPTKGQPGFDVTGHVRQARDGAPVASPVGTNTALSEDGLHVVASCGGAVVLQAGKICVTQAVEIPQVDSSTGNIVFTHGSVVVVGDVKEGFSITVGKDISVKGNVEGAKLTAGGSITLQHGMNGLGSGAIDAGANVNANFLENIDIRANGTVTADVIINCRINCKGDVLLKGPSANLVGGVCTTYGSVKAKDIGNDLDVVTKIELIGQKTIAKEREGLAAKVEENAEELRKLFKIAEAGTRPRALITEKRTAEKALVELQRMKDETEEYQARLEQLQATLDSMGELGVVMAWGTMYPNTRMNFDTLKLNNAFPRASCCAFNDKGEIAFRTGQKF